MGRLSELQMLNLTSCKSLTSLPDLSGLEKLQVDHLPEAMKPWEERGRKAFALPTHKVTIRGGARPRRGAR